MGGYRQQFLAVDDEPLGVQALRATLRRRGEVVAAGSLAEARKVMTRYAAWDAMFADTVLPDGSGLDLVAEFRRLFPDVPVLVLSGHVQGQMANSAFDLGAEIMGKPCDPARIRLFLDGCPRHTRRPSAPVPSDMMAGIGETLDKTISYLRTLLERPSEALTRYAVGCIIARLKREPHGARAVQTAAEALAEDLPSLYRYAKVAERWSAMQVEQLLTRRGPNGYRLSWSHLVLLAPVDSDAARAVHIEKALNQELSVRALAQLLAQWGSTKQGPYSNG